MNRGVGRLSVQQRRYKQAYLEHLIGVVSEADASKVADAFDLTADEIDQVHTEFVHELKRRSSGGWHGRPRF